MDVNLHLDWCSHEAAKYAVENWHYSKRMPMPPLLKIGVWEDGLFVGCIIYGTGAGQSTNGNKYGLPKRYAIAELVRVALNGHKTPVSKMLAVSIKMVKHNSPNLKMLISFADVAEGHHGGIYQATNWVYTGQTEETVLTYHGGRWKHTREIAAKTAFGVTRNKVNADNLPKKKMPGKHRYLYPLDDEMRKQIEPLRQPYPKRPKQATSNSN